MPDMSEHVAAYLPEKEHVLEGTDAMMGICSRAAAAMSGVMLVQLCHHGMLRVITSDLAQDGAVWPVKTCVFNST
ncbi:predicted protein [Pyrenophora tritici-repentis Pt-1C-BFP]|uniref:Uncharacterized protein n=1 Tax=Pyrenophora tritici-repentis (strain Pt-1C-BFP) TaxID=426418 RepID=B2VSX7_PYRTR|nr:uncharacterized protein PTRG_00761 [Pyrenophora tritici-repentis Pt-1C-BFP]EDU40199.1 predicted protein [Pyrenophora tritici-repentis Pt-1C-BFP]